MRLKRIIITVLILGTCLSHCGKNAVIKKDTGDINKYIKLYDSENWVDRLSAIRKISEYNSKESADLLIKATEDVHGQIKISALEALSESLPLSALRRIKHIAEHENDANIRWQAVKTLGRYKEPASALIFAKGLKSNDWLIREESIRGLLKINDYSIKFVSIPYIIEALDDPVESVRIATLTNLDFQEQRIYNKITEMLQNTLENKHSLLKALLISLKGYRIDEETKKVIIDLLTHRNKEIRIMALRALKQDKNNL